MKHEQETNNLIIASSQTKGYKIENPAIYIYAHCMLCVCSYILGLL